MSDDILLTLAGGQFGGWKEVRVSRGIEQIAGAFVLDLTERWPGQHVARAISEGDACEVTVNGELVITGYIDDVAPHLSADETGIRCTGRDRTGDLVDCAARHATGEWAGVGLAEVAADLVEPFGIPLVLETGVGAPFTHSFALQSETETVFEAIERAARMRGVLLVSDGRGGLTLTRAGSSRITTSLVEGENILAGTGERSLRERFSEYHVVGQAPGDDQHFGEAVAAVAAVETDTAVPRYRPLVVHAEDNTDQATAEQRARWEKNVRAGRARRLKVSVVGWSHASGVWHPNRLVQVDSPTLKAAGEFLIVHVELERSRENGTLAHLTLTDPRAFEVEPLPEEAPDDSGFFPGE